ncbi:unnamed protein product [Rotaria sordida]|uniref:Uncharacterized protein n=1 Tax=Rotaria sordida TaxID=392033 RepID=A0A819TWV3_9BILA|nr:unnamed protein product [Rotaria sordida]
MYQKYFYCRRVIEKRKRRLRRLEKSVNYSDISSSSGNENDRHMEDTQHRRSTINNSSSVLDEDACSYEKYHGGEHDNTTKAIDIEDDFLDRLPLL